jgi:hypothetical protein
MAFQLYTVADAPPVEFGDRASYNFNTHGLLVITTGDGKRLTYSPQAWLRIEDHPNASVW